MKKFILLIAFFAFASSTVANAQIEKKRLLIDYFSASDNLGKKNVDAVRDMVISGIQATSRMSVIDVDSESSLAVESERRSDVSSLDDDTARLGEIKQLGADFLLNGTINSFTIEKKKTDDGKVYFDTELTITLKFIDVSNGTLFATKTVKSYGGGNILGSGSTEEKAISGAISVTTDKMTRIIDEFFPLKGTIVELLESKKGKLISCYVDLGTGHGVSKGQFVKVSKMKEIAGRQSTIEVGRMKIETCVAEDLSECKVTKGGEEILAAFNDGSELVIETIKARGLMGGLDSLTE